MKTFLYDWSSKDYSQTPTDDYKNKFQYVTSNFRGQWQPNTFYSRGDVVFDTKLSSKFYILYFEGTSNNSDIIYDDELEWTEYNASKTLSVTNFNEILSQGDVSKYTNDSDYYDLYNVPVGIKIEQIAYEYYNDVNYWDVILVMNNIPTYLNLPSSNDYVIDKALTEVKKWGELFKYSDLEYKFLEGKLKNNLFQVPLEPTITLSNEASTGIIYSNIGDIIKVENYNNQIKYFRVIKKPKREVKVSFNSAKFPLSVGDKVGFLLENVEISYSVPTATDTNIYNVMEGAASPLLGSKGLSPALNNNDIYGIEYQAFSNINSLETTNYITITNTDEISTFTISKLIQSNDYINITEVENKSVEYYLENNYIEEIITDYLSLDILSTEYINKVQTLYTRYLKFYDKFLEENDKFKTIKLLKQEYLDDFKEAFLSTITTKKGL